MSDDDPPDPNIGFLGFASSRHSDTPAGCFWFFIGFIVFILVGLVVAKLLS